MSPVGPPDPTLAAVLILVWWIGPIAVLVWVDRDVRDRDMHRTLWGALVAATSVVGLAAYLVARSLDETGRAGRP